MKNQMLQLGVVGVGAMGGNHTRALLKGCAPSVRITALCDINPEAGREFAPIPFYTDSREMLEHAGLDAVFVATPHFQHDEVGVAALEKGLHVLVEKPMAADKNGCENLLRARDRSGKVLSTMLSMRTKPIYSKIKSLLADGELGVIRRVHWTATHWFRTETYYSESDWRGTWKGEGGGVLLNQCPHQLDLLCWFFGLPKKVSGFCEFGRYHDIEAEDDVLAVLHYPDRMKVVFEASTGEFPGTDRLEIVGEMGRLVAEGGHLKFERNRVPMSEFSKSSDLAMKGPECWPIDIPLGTLSSTGHIMIFENFAGAILRGETLIAPPEEAWRGVELANAMQLSTWNEAPVRLPLDQTEYAARRTAAADHAAPIKTPRSL